ncbi:EXT1C protein, partial [Calcarius ornatus]|nr:EXT1C protein [Calcarius ornatus]
MQTRKKYIFLTFLASWLLLFFFGGDQLRRFAFFSTRKAEAPRSWPRWTDQSLLKSFAEPEELQRDGDRPLPSPRERRAAWRSAHGSGRCRMETCFDLSRCERNGFKVFTYPQERGQPVSETYSKILSSIERSRYHTRRPEEACLFILGIDTLDRDRLSGHYVRDLEEKIRSSPLWNGGRNHLIFNLYSGTWPGYGGELGFEPGRAILARASSDSGSFRPGFDVSIPLFPREHPQRGGHRRQGGPLPPRRKFLLVFKGKRYLTGIGSGTRNALRHIHNGKDIISLTTCKHGKDWEKHKDTRCDKDNVDYERWVRDRGVWGRGTPHKCRPKCLSVARGKFWVLLRGMRVCCTVGNEALTTQGFPALPPVGSAGRSETIWNGGPTPVQEGLSPLELGSHPSVALWAVQEGLAHLEWGSHPSAVPVGSAGGSEPVGMGVPPQCSPCGQCRSVWPIWKPSQPLRPRLSCPSQIVVLWSCEKPPPPSGKWPQSSVPVTIVRGRRELSDRFFPFGAIQTDAVLSLDEDSSLSTSEVDFAFSVWLSFPERIVGFPTQSHFWDAERGRWGCTSGRTNELSMVLTAAAFYHRYYHSLFTELLPAGLRGAAACGDIAMNALVAAVTELPPIKVAQRKEGAARCGQGAAGTPGPASQHRDCLEQLADWFGYMPLVSSRLRLDPVLFKDQVSVLRKRYPSLEKP